jgi:tRNA U34 5-carboxymethylaminomethyl modifying enzyme MnmG/GidA
MYKENMQKIILNTKNLNVLAEPVDDLVLIDESDSSKKRVSGIVLGNVFVIFSQINNLIILKSLI